MQIGFLGVLTLIFVAAKIFGYITWSWWIIFSPVIFGFVFIVGVFLLAVLLGFKVNMKWR